MLRHRLKTGDLASSSKRNAALSITRILRAALAKFCVYVCVTTPPKPLNGFA